MGFGDRQRIGMCCRTAPTKPIFSRKEMKTAIPPNGVTARCVSRRINRSFDNSAVISRGTGLSVAFDSIPLLSQILGRNPTSNFGFSAQSSYNGFVPMDLKKKLQDQTDALSYEMHNQLPMEIRRAREHGDLSENAEYHAAKERQGMVNARLNQLVRRLAELSMVDFSKIPHDRVGLGSVVKLLDVKKDEELTYTLVTSEEADAGSGRISTSSPIGRGLIGKEPGDVVKVQVAGGVREFEILHLTTIHEIVE